MHTKEALVSVDGSVERALAGWGWEVGVGGLGAFEENCFFCLILSKQELVYSRVQPNVEPLIDAASQSLVLNGLVRDSADC